MADNQTINEEQLAEVAGGTENNQNGKCFFTIKNLDTKWDKGFLWLECLSTCIGCKCRGKAHCVDKWHIIDHETRELYPQDYSNHLDKKAINRYNTHW